MKICSLEVHDEKVPLSTHKVQHEHQVFSEKMNHSRYSLYCPYKALVDSNLLLVPTIRSSRLEKRELFKPWTVAVMLEAVWSVLFRW